MYYKRIFLDLINTARNYFLGKIIMCVLSVIIIEFGRIISGIVTYQNHDADVEHFLFDVCY